MVKGKKFTYSKAFEGAATKENFTLEEEELPEIQDGDVLFEAVFWSVDPYMRPYLNRFPVGITMIGSQVSRVVETKDPNYKVGTLWVLYSGWKTHTVMNSSKDTGSAMSQPPMPVPDLGSLPSSVALGAVGMPGNTAYFGFLEICQPKAGETVVVSGAAGAVGSVVGQIAKIKGCKVIGFAGTDEKVKWLTEDLGFDHAFNYKTNDLKESLKKAAPNGVDCYFDNVGGMTSHIVMEQMNDFGRVSCCGAISSYNEKDISTMVPSSQALIVFKQLKIEGFIVMRWKDRWMEGLTQLTKWIQEGKIKYRETVMNGFESMPDAMIGLMKGDNTGKMIIKA